MGRELLRPAPSVVAAVTLLLVPTEARAIVNGTVDPGDPAVVWLGSCSGVVISPSIVLTARACVDQPVQFGPNRDEITTTIGHYRAEAHPTEDLALLQLRERAPVTPIAVNDAPLDAYLGQEARIVGFGTTGALAADDGVRRQGRATLGALAGEELHLDADEASPCESDAGGPILLTVDGVERVVGVMSAWPSGCGVSPWIGIRTDAFTDWIFEFIERWDTSNTPPTVSIVAPMDGEAVYPTFEVVVDAADNLRVSRVELWVDDVLHDTEVDPPFTLTSMPTVARGPHALEVRAFDLADLWTSAAITVVIGAACDIDSDCEDGETCQGGACLVALGAYCERHTDCASGLCGATDGFRFCTQVCEPGVTDCPSGFVCVAAEFGGASQCARDEPQGDCRAAPSRRRSAPWVLVFVLLFVRRRKR